ARDAYRVRRIGGETRAEYGERSGRGEPSAEKSSPSHSARVTRSPLRTRHPSPAPQETRFLARGSTGGIPSVTWNDPPRFTILAGVMMQANPTAIRLPRVVSAIAACMLALAATRSLLAQGAPAPSQLSALQGFVLDSIHDGGLANAVVIIEGTGRTGITQADGRFRVDSIPVGKHRIMVMHPLLDTLGVVMRTPDPLDFSKPMHTLDLSLP